MFFNRPREIGRAWLWAEMEKKQHVLKEKNPAFTFKMTQLFWGELENQVYPSFPRIMVCCTVCVCQGIRLNLGKRSKWIILGYFLKQIEPKIKPLLKFILFKQLIRTKYKNPSICFQELRVAHLPDLLCTYFDVFQTYLKDVHIEMTFEEFSKEVYERRDIMLSFGTLVRYFSCCCDSVVMTCSH